MNYPELRQELKEYYWQVADGRAAEFYQECTALMDATASAEMTPLEQKCHQYRTISEQFEPVLFENCPFYFETGTMSAQCDGARSFRGHRHAGGWTYRKNAHLFEDQDPTLWALKNAQAGELFYLICGPYNDTSQHFAFNHRPILEKGLKGIYEEAQKAAESAETAQQRQFLAAVCEGLLCLKKMSERFGEKAEELISTAAPEAKANYKRIARSAARCPWEKPESFYEALNCYAFMRKAVGSLEGIGVNSFGRVDLDLYPFYKADIESGALTEEEAYELICRFLITFDTHYDHDMKMVGYSDHEMENTYVLGGCDENGAPLYNELTRLFLTAIREEQIIYPKIKCRYGAASPKEYLDEINAAVIAGTSTVLYQNDDATIPALVRAGRTLSEARDYIVDGCWGLHCNGIEKPDSGAYVNLIKPFEYSLHRLQAPGMSFAPIDGAQDFETVYRITLDNLRVLLEERARITRLGGNIWHRVDPLPLFSSTLADCIENKKDYTEGGARYRDDNYLCFGLPNIVDSLLAIRELCFEQKKCSLQELLEAVRGNWEGKEELRLAATRCHGWGDGSEASNALARRLNDDLFSLCGTLTGTYGGKVHLGHLTYTEIRFWGEQTLATPDGRRNGDYFSQGLTPSRLKRIPSVTSVIDSLSALDATTMAGNTVVNIILPSGKVSADILAAFLRAAAGSAMMSLQLNCLAKETLLDAQKHPEKYPHLIVRVTGFSARFTALSPEWQKEVLTRNFYE